LTPGDGKRYACFMDTMEPQAEEGESGGAARDWFPKARGGQARVAPASPGGKDPNMDPVEVLMVEDNPGDVLLLQEAVASVGLAYRIQVVHDGVEAMEYLRTQGEYGGAVRPDLIVLDLKLPRKNGREVLDEIRQDLVLSGIPLVLLSSSRSELEAARSNRLPAGGCMVKPSTFSGYVALAESIESFRRGARPTGG